MRKLCIEIKKYNKSSISDYYCASLHSLFKYTLTAWGYFENALVKITKTSDISDFNHSNK